ncbi:hypothetical protein HN803_01995 [candidate division WWE3 bacterium]|jgi:hypothetical protein|nr:hypothetical protein [candidate division WWE3 bacterium]MBT7349544.1 hypothetical protein [candidate division WWE3 bacterium]
MPAEKIDSLEAQALTQAITNARESIEQAENPDIDEGTFEAVEELGGDQRAHVEMISAMGEKFPYAKHRRGVKSEMYPDANGMEYIAMEKRDAGLGDNNEVLFVCKYGAFSVGVPNGVALNNDEVMAFVAYVEDNNLDEHKDTEHNRYGIQAGRTSSKLVAEGNLMENRIFLRKLRVLEGMSQEGGMKKDEAEMFTQFVRKANEQFVADIEAARAGLKKKEIELKTLFSEEDTPEKEAPSTPLPSSVSGSDAVNLLFN